MRTGGRFVEREEASIWREVAELCEALTLSLAVENEARMRAMTGAKSNVSTMLDDLLARSRQLRQEEITNEIIELGGRNATGPPGASHGR